MYLFAFYITELRKEKSIKIFTGLKTREALQKIERARCFMTFYIAPIECY
jgi:hypothetical protein